MPDTELHDPRQEIPHDLAVGQVYRDERSGDEKRVIYIDDMITVLRYNHDGRTNHTLERRGTFEENVGSGRFELTEETSGSPRIPDDFDEVRALARRMHDHYTSIGSRTGQHKAEAMAEFHDELGEIAGEGAEEFDFESINGIGAGAAQNLREAGIRTAMDVRRTDKEQIMKIPLMGEANTSNLLEAV